MSSKVMIDGTAYSIKKGRTLIDGTGYSIKKGRTLIDGTGYDIKLDDLDFTYTYGTYAGGSATVYALYVTGGEGSIDLKADIAGYQDPGKDYWARLIIYNKGSNSLEGRVITLAYSCAMGSNSNSHVRVIAANSSGTSLYLNQLARDGQARQGTLVTEPLPAGTTMLYVQALANGYSTEAYRPMASVHISSLQIDGEEVSGRFILP